MNTDFVAYLLRATEALRLRATPRSQVNLVLQRLYNSYLVFIVLFIYRHFTQICKLLFSISCLWEYKRGCKTSISPELYCIVGALIKRLLKQDNTKYNKSFPRIVDVFIAPIIPINQFK